MTSVALVESVLSARRADVAMMWSEYNRFVRVCPLLERLDELLSVAREHATQSIKAFVHLTQERSPAPAPGP